MTMRERLARPRAGRMIFDEFNGMLIEASKNTPVDEGEEYGDVDIIDSFSVSWYDNPEDFAAAMVAAAKFVRGYNRPGILLHVTFD